LIKLCILEITASARFRAHETLIGTRSEKNDPAAPSLRRNLPWRRYRVSGAIAFRYVKFLLPLCYYASGFARLRRNAAGIGWREADAGSASSALQSLMGSMKGRRKRPVARFIRDDR